jgi:hypothetical protein
MDRGKIWIAEDLDAALPDDLRKTFYGGGIPKPQRSESEVPG